MPEHSRLIFCLACAVLVILSCMAAGCSSSPAPSAATPQPAAPGGTTITIKNFTFDPSTVTVKTGSAVTWVNGDSPPHTIASDSGSPAAFTSDTLSTGASYTFTFTRPGTYTYHCSIHPSMKGTVIVQ